MPNTNSTAVVDERRAGLIRGLRELAEFLETNPDVLTPMPCSFNAFARTKDVLASQARLTNWQKRWTSDWLTLVKEFAGDVQLDINLERDEVCRRVVTGTRIEPAQPAQPEREVEIVEWVCEDASILAGAR